MKKHLEYHSKHNFLNGIWKTFGVVILGSLTGTFAKLGILDQIYKVLAKGQQGSTVLKQIELIIQIGAMSLITLIAILFIKNELTVEKRRIDLLISVVDTIIKEKEAKSKNN